MTAVVRLIAVNYFGASSVSRLIDSLVHQTHSAWELLLVDNSTDSEQRKALDEAASVDDRVSVHSMDRNLGYFGGVGWALATFPMDPDWFVFCNVDVHLGTNEFLAQLARVDPGLTVVAPRVVARPSGRELNPYMLQKPTQRYLVRRRRLFQNVFLAQIYSLVANRVGRVARRRSHRLRPQGKIYAPHGSFMILRGAFLRQNSIPVHPVFLFGEEFTVAEYVRRAGSEVTYVPGLHVIHDEHQSTGTWRSRKIISYQAEALGYVCELLGRAD